MSEFGLPLKIEGDLKLFGDRNFRSDLPVTPEVKQFCRVMAANYYNAEAAFNDSLGQDAEVERKFNRARLDWLNIEKLFLRSIFEGE